MTILTEGESSFFLQSPAMLIDDAKDVASSWASGLIVSNPALKWILAKYVEADNANNNGQYWGLDDLRVAKSSIVHSPMNIDHHKNEIVGSFVGAELLYPTSVVEMSFSTNPYVEVLGAFWRYYFPDTLSRVESAFDSGLLSASMECVAESITCVGTDVACGETFAYQGSISESYCVHLQDRSAFRQFNKPHFLGGALILPPNKPGWKDARVKEIAHMVSDDEANRLIEEIAEEMPDGSLIEWETLMWQMQLRRFTTTA